MVFSAKKVSPVVHSSGPYQQSSPVIIDSLCMQQIKFGIHVQLKSHRQFIDSYNAARNPTVLSISHSVRIDAADLHVDLLLSILQNS